jgi:hypothetical protein
VTRVDNRIGAGKRLFFTMRHKVAGESGNGPVGFLTLFMRSD